MKFSICNELFDGWTFDKTCAAIKRAGYEGVEIAPFTLRKPINEVTAEERANLRGTAEEHGLRIVGLHWLLAQTEGLHINSADKAVRDRTAKYLIELANLCADLGGDIMVFGSPKQRNIAPGLTREQAWSHAIETFRQVVPVMEARGVRLCLEPLAPQETDFINTAAEAAKMVREISSESLQLLLDVKAMVSEPTPIPDIIRANARMLRHFHANDANKRGPGFGDTDFAPIAAALKEVGYAGWVSVEVFDFKPDPETVANGSLEYLKKVFA